MRHNFLKRFDCHEFFRRLNYKYWDSGNYRTSAGFAKYLSTMPTQLKQRSWQHRVPTIRTTIFNCTIFSFFFLFCLNGSANAQTPKANKGDGIDVTKPEFMDKYDVNDRIQIAWSTLTPAQQACDEDIMLPALVRGTQHAEMPLAESEGHSHARNHEQQPHGGDGRIRVGIWRR